MIWLKRSASYVASRWERLLFGFVGFICLGFSLAAMIRGDVTRASAIFAMGFFSFFYSNLARFRRFKGLGFEAELWDDKQQEAADLIERLKNVVSIYTREIVMGTVMRGRMGGADSWSKRWALFNDLSSEHADLGQKIDFTKLKTDIDSVFIFDLVVPLAGSVRKAVSDARSKAQPLISERYGKVVTNLAGHNADHAKLRDVGTGEVDNLFERAHRENIARTVLAVAEHARETLSASFGIMPEYDPLVLERLGVLAETIEKRPLVVTPELVQWADTREM